MSIKVLHSNATNQQTSKMGAEPSNVGGIGGLPWVVQQTKDLCNSEQCHGF